MIDIIISVVFFQSVKLSVYTDVNACSLCQIIVYAINIPKLFNIGNYDIIQTFKEIHRNNKNNENSKDFSIWMPLLSCHVEECNQDYTEQRLT